MTPHQVTLDGGPVAGERVTATDPFVWVVRQGGRLHVFDLDKPAAQQDVRPTAWDEYLEDPQDPTVYRYHRTTP